MKPEIYDIGEMAYKLAFIVVALLTLTIVSLSVAIKKLIKELKKERGKKNEIY